MLIVSLYSPKQSYDALFLANYANININDALFRVPGVGEVRIFGAGDYAMRIWVKPDVLARLGLTVTDVRLAIQQQNVVNPAGQVGAEPAPARPGDDLHGARAGPPADAGGVRRHRRARRTRTARVVRLSDVARVELGALNYQQIGASTASRPRSSPSSRPPARTRSRSPTASARR